MSLYLFPLQPHLSHSYTRKTCFILVSQSYQALFHLRTFAWNSGLPSSVWLTLSHLSDLRFKSLLLIGLLWTPKLSEFVRCILSWNSVFTDIASDCNCIFICITMFLLYKLVASMSKQYLFNLPLHPQNLAQYLALGRHNRNIC